MKMSQSLKLQSFKKNKLLIFVVLIYIGMFMVMREKAVQSFHNSMYYVIEMIEIIPVIFILTSLIEAWVPKKVIMNSFGKNSGAKGCIYSFLIGSLSAGPIYAAFPICKMLLKKGASIMNIVIILSAWAVIKVPMLANEAKFLGIKFMGFRWILTLISITIMGYVVSKIIGDGSQILAENKQKIGDGSEILEKDRGSRILIDRQYCIGCGVCVRLAPKKFKVQDGKAILIDDLYTEDMKLKIKKVVDNCPTHAISYI
ncbi:hypothetical protein SH2C18_23650 [Clostridium sediminicola]|uniref:permease n=1 Tax=Clostridium sediminicola TaxID=3114879 RepID=UPI0031F21591